MNNLSLVLLKLNVETVGTSIVLIITNSTDVAVPLAWHITGWATISRKTNSAMIVVAICPFVFLFKSVFVGGVQLKVHVKSVVLRDPVV